MGVFSDLPIIYSIACLILGLSYAYFLYAKEALLSSNFLIVFLFLVRTLFIGFLTFLLLNPIVKSYQKIVEQPIVILVQDNSSSIIDTSSVYFLNQIATSLEDFEVHKFSFSEVVSLGFSSENKGLLTNYSSLFSTLDSRFLNRNVSAIVLASDGLYNTGANPLLSKLNNIPIYTIAQGDTAIIKDVIVTKALCNDIAFLGNSFPLEISLAFQKCIGEKIKLAVWNNNKELYSKMITVKSDDYYQKLKVVLEAESVGLQQYTVVATQVNGEKNIENNSHTAYVDVIDSRINIALIAGKTHPDIAAYKSVIDKNKNYTSTLFKASDFNENFDKYQLVVLFGVSSEAEIISKLKSSTTPVIIFELQETDLKKDFNQAFNFVSRGGLEDVKVIRNTNFSKFSFSPELTQLIDLAPPLTALFGKYTLQLGAEVVLNQKIGVHATENPVITISNNDGRKMACISAEGFWRWKLFDYNYNANTIAFDELFAKLTQYLVLKDDKSNFRIKYNKQVSENENIHFEAYLYNESYELINNKEVELIIRNKEGEQFNFEFNKTDSYYSLNAGVFDVGSYSFTANVKGSAIDKSSVFNVKPIQLEQLNTVANHQLLYKLSFASDGALYYPNQYKILAEEIVNNKNNYKKIFIKENLEGLINIPWILLSLLGLITIEWVVRKFNGLI